MSYRLLFVVFALVVAACGGGSADPPGATNGEVDSATTGSESSESTASEVPVTGALVSVTAIDLGFYELDRESGKVAPITAAEVEFVDRTQEPVVSGSVGYTIGYSLIAGQSFSSAVSLVRVDLDGGVGTVVAELGQNRANDDDVDLVEWQLVGSSPTVVWLTEAMFGSGELTFIAFDPTSGAETARFSVAEEPLFDPIVVGDGLVAQQSGSIVRVDESGSTTALLSFESGGPTAIPTLFPSVADQAEFIVVAGGGTPTDEAIERAMSFQSSNPSSKWTTDSESLWWVFSELTTLTTGETAAITGVMRYNLATDAVTAWPLGDFAEEFGDDNTVSSMSQPDLMVRNGTLWIVDIRDDGSIYRLDPESGSIDAYPMVAGDSVDFVRLEAVTTDPEAVWVKTTRFMITSEDASGTTSVGEVYFERVDEESGTVTVSVPALDLNGL